MLYVRHYGTHTIGLEDPNFSPSSGVTFLVLCTIHTTEKIPFHLCPPWLCVCPEMPTQFFYFIVTNAPTLKLMSHKTNLQCTGISSIFSSASLPLEQRFLSLLLPKKGFSRWVTSLLQINAVLFAAGARSHQGHSEIERLNESPFPSRTPSLSGTLWKGTITDIPGSRNATSRRPKKKGYKKSRAVHHLPLWSTIPRSLPLPARLPA